MSMSLTVPAELERTENNSVPRFYSELYWSRRVKYSFSRRETCASQPRESGSARFWNHNPLTSLTTPFQSILSPPILAWAESASASD